MNQIKYKQKVTINCAFMCAGRCYFPEEKKFQSSDKIDIVQLK